MKKYIAILSSILIVFSLNYNIAHGSSPIQININNIPMSIDVSPEVISGRTMVPFRAIFEGLGAKVEWDEDTKEGKGILENGKWISFSKGRHFANSYKGSIDIDSPATIKNGRLLVPVKVISESFGAEISWSPEKRLVSIITESKSTLPVFQSMKPIENIQEPYMDEKNTVVSKSGEYIFLGQSENQVISTLGNPQRIDLSENGYSVYIYNGDYSKYIQIGIHNNKVVEIYTNSKSWSFSQGISVGSSKADVNLKIGSSISTYNPNLTLQFDKLSSIPNEGNVIGIRLMDKSIRFNRVYNENVIKGFEKQVFDLTNSYRVSNGLRAFDYCIAASKASRLHSIDMANSKYFSHQSLNGYEPWERMELQGIRYSLAGENIAMGQQNAIDVVEAWINSSGHRKNLLGDFKALGVGIYSQGNASGTYYTQNFYTAR